MVTEHEALVIYDLSSSDNIVSFNPIFLLLCKGEGEDAENT